MATKVDHTVSGPEKHSLNPSLAQNDPSSTALSRQTWKVYLDEASKEDQEIFNGWQSDMDTLLIFAALFSAVLTAFVIATLPTLQEDENVKVLQEILRTLQNNSSTLSELSSSSNGAFKPANSFVRVNVLWITSLIISISTAFMAILAKQWIYNLRTSMSPLPVAGGRQRQYRLDGLRTWKLPSIITSLPVLLHIAVLLFFAGLLDYLWNINRLVAAVSTVFIGSTVLVYCATSILSMMFPSCPYKTSLTSLIFSGIDSSIDSLFRLVASFGSNVNRIGSEFMERYLCPCLACVTEDGPLSNSQMAAMVQKLSARSFGSSVWRSVSPLFLSPEKRENASIQAARPRLDAAVLAWMVERSSRLEDVSSLAKELCHFEGLLRERLLFLESDAVIMLVRHLHFLGSVSGEDAQERRDDVYDTLDALLQLTTETRHADSPMLPFLGRGYPYFHEFFDIGYYAEGLMNSPLIRADPSFQNPFQDDLYFVAAALRLNVATSYEEEWKQYNVSQSIDQFNARVSANSCAELKTCSDRSLRTTLDTAIYIGLQASTYDLSSLTSTDLVHQILRLLSDISANVPSISYQARRQICWGIWALAYRLDEDHTLLTDVFKYCACVLPRLTGVSGWAEHFAALLHVKADATVLEAVVVVAEGLFYSRPTGKRADEDVDAEDSERLCAALAKVFPTFLTEYTAHLRAHIYTKKTDSDTNSEAALDVASMPAFMKRLTNIASYLAFYYQYKSPEDAVLIRGSLELLSFAAANRHTPPFQGLPWVDCWIWSTLCRITFMQLHDPSSPHPLTEAFTSEMHASVQSIALALLSTLRAAQTAEGALLQESLGALLRVLMQVFRSSHNDSEETAVLRDVLLEHDVVAVLGLLRDGPCGLLAVELLSTIHS